MKPELMLLVWSVLLAFVQMLIAVTGATLQVGLPTLAANRAAASMVAHASRDFPDQAKAMP